MEELESDPNMEKKAKELREKVGTQKKNETEDQTKERMKKALSDRDTAMRAVYDYQDATGIPSEEETAQNFFENETKQD